MDHSEDTSSDQDVATEQATEYGLALEYKSIVKWRDQHDGKWTIEESESMTKLTAETKLGRYTQYSSYSFLIRQKIKNSESHSPSYTTTILIINKHLKDALKIVLRDEMGLSWNSKIFKIDPMMLLAHISKIRQLVKLLCSMPASSLMADHLSILLKYLETEYSSLLRKIASYHANDETTFQLLWALLLPKTVMVSLCQITGEPRLFRLVQKRRSEDPIGDYWSLTCEYVNSFSELSQHGEVQFGMATSTLKIRAFKGIKKIEELTVHPLHYHPLGDTVRSQLIERGRKWSQWNGVYHLQHDGRAHRDQQGKINVNGRVMIDRYTFANTEPNYCLEEVEKSRSQRLRRSIFEQLFWNLDDDQSIDAYDSTQPLGSQWSLEDLTEEHLALATPILYGYSLSDKMWMEFNVENLTEIQWNTSLLSHLAINLDRKLLLESLIVSHAEKKQPDDFVTSKGLGLVFNLFGPPGVGKSMTVEAAAEHLRRPLYVVTAGDLGSSATSLDKHLAEIFSLAPKWNALVLIDDADVFLEKRSSVDLNRNAMVSVFLRQIEYFRGILFLTTNRVKEFDEAFQSRIHVSLYYKDLENDAKEKIWTAFLQKLDSATGAGHSLTTDDIKIISKRRLNGRQIKNAFNLAAALASREEKAMLTMTQVISVVEMIEPVNCI